MPSSLASVSATELSPLVFSVMTSFFPGTPASAASAGADIRRRTGSSGASERAAIMAAHPRGGGPQGQWIERHWAEPIVRTVLFRRWMVAKAWGCAGDAALAHAVLPGRMPSWIAAGAGKPARLSVEDLAELN